MLRVHRIVVCGILLLVSVLILGLDGSMNPIQAQEAYPDQVVRDLKGVEHRLWPDSNERATVVMFITTDCPIANSYQPELRRLQEEYEGHGMRFFMIHEGADLGREKLEQHAKEYEVKATLVADDQHRIARSLGAKVTPEVIVIGAQGKVLYQGRIDDRYPKYGKKRAVVGDQELRTALTSIVDGKTVLVPRTEAVGCLIRFAKEAE